MILISTDASLDGGISRFCRTLEQNLDIEKRVDLTLDGSGREHLRLYGRAPVYIFPLRKMIRHLVHTSGSIIINDPQFSTVSWVTLFYSLFSRRDVYFISHGFMFHNNPNSWIKRIYFSILVHSVFNVVKVICVSESDARKCRDSGFRKYKLIPHGVPTYGPRHRKYFSVCVGRDAPHKRLNDYVQLVDRLRGGGTNPSRYALISNYPKVSYKELDQYHSLEDDEITDIYRASKYVISFSEYEGFGLAVIEAAASGAIPVVYANESFSKIFSSVPEVLFRGRSIGCALASINAIEMLSQDELDSLMHRIEQSIKPYSIEVMLKNYNLTLGLSDCGASK